MTKRVMLYLTCALALVASVSVAQAASSHSVKDTMKLRVLTGNANLVIYTGTVQDSAQGAGVVVVRVTPAAAANTVNTLATAFFKKGTVTFKGSNTTAAQPDGGTVYAGTTKAVSGTGALKGVTGTIKIKGSSTAADPTYGTYTLTGALKY